MARGAPVIGGEAKGKEAAAAVIGGKGKEAASGKQHQQEVIPDGSAAVLEAMKPDLAVSAPPDITHLSMVRQTARGLPFGLISSTDKALVVLYAGEFQPEYSSGCHLVYDACSNSLSAIPQIPYSRKHPINILGNAAAILSRGEGTYVLAELFAEISEFPDAALYLWWSPTQNQQSRWIRKPVRLPPQVFVPDFFFSIDMAFSYKGSSVCWVDLLEGVLVCDLLTSSEPEFRFVPLPEGYSIDVTNRRLPEPNEFRTMGCVRGVIKFVTSVGFYENGYPSSDIMLKTWTLSPDLNEWTAGTPLRVGDLWASESFRERDLPRLPPSFPVVSMDEPEVVYVILNDFDRVDTFDSFGDATGVQIVPKAWYVLRLDTVQNKVLSSTKIIAHSVTPQIPILLASGFSAYLHGSKDHQGGLEASEVGASRKRMNKRMKQ